MKYMVTVATGWREEYRKFEALLAWKEDFIPKLWPLVHAVRGCCALSELWKNFLLRRVARAVRTWKFGHFSFVLVSFSPCPVFGCCLWCAAFWIFREILRALHLVRQWIHVLREALDEFLTFSTLRCSLPSRRPNPIPAIPPYVVSMEHRHSGGNIFCYTLIQMLDKKNERNTRKKRKRKRSKRKSRKKGWKKTRKEASKGCFTPRDGPKNCFFFEM